MDAVVAKGNPLHQRLVEGVGFRAGGEVFVFFFLSGWGDEDLGDGVEYTKPVGTVIVKFGVIQEVAFRVVDDYAEVKGVEEGGV